jgi:hypothetical protein
MNKIKIIDVKKGDRRLEGFGTGLINYKEKTIYVRKGLTPLQRKTTIEHEKGHLLLRKLKINQFPKSIVKELRKSNRYKSYIPEGYQRRKIPEEFFADIYGAIKSGEINKSTFRKYFKPYPKSYKLFSKLINKKL